MTRPALALLGAFCLLASAVYADIAPKPSAHPQTPSPLGVDLPGVEVEMVSEDVSLLLRHDKPKHDKLEVVAVFRMKNHGPTATFETGFPIGPYRNIESFSVEIDSKPVDFDVIDRGSDTARQPAFGRRSSIGSNHDYWYVWNATYPAGVTSVHVVRYVLDIFRPTGSQQAGYVLHTGEWWKGPIGKARVTLRCDNGLALDHFLTVSPRSGGVREEDRIV